MRSKLFLLLALVGFFSNVSAQVCKINESGDNVEVFSAIIESENTVAVTVGNDSQDISANVTVTVEVTYKKGNAKHTQSFTGKGIAKPNQETIIRISIPAEDKSGYKPYSVKVTGITGNKCS